MPSHASNLFKNAPEDIAFNLFNKDCHSITKISVCMDYTCSTCGYGGSSDGCGCIWKSQWKSHYSHVNINTIERISCETMKDLEYKHASQDDRDAFKEHYHEILLNEIKRILLMVYKVSPEILYPREDKFVDRCIYKL